MRWLAALDARLGRLETAVLVALLVGMIGLSLTSMVLRWMGTGLAASDPLLRHGILWLGMLGGVAAARSGQHIQIGAVQRLLSPGKGALVGRALALGAAALCGVLAVAGWQFVAGEREAGTEAFGGVPLWPLQTVIPGGFALMALRYALQIVLGPPPDPNAEGTAPEETGP